MTATVLVNRSEISELKYSGLHNEFNFRLERVTSRKGYWVGARVRILGTRRELGSEMRDYVCGDFKQIDHFSIKVSARIDILEAAVEAISKAIPPKGRHGEEPNCFSSIHAPLWIRLIRGLEFQATRLHTLVLIQPVDLYDLCIFQFGGNGPTNIRATGSTTCPLKSVNIWLLEIKDGENSILEGHGGNRSQPSSLPQFSSFSAIGFGTPKAFDSAATAEPCRSAPQHQRPVARIEPVSTTIGVTPDFSSYTCCSETRDLEHLGGILGYFSVNNPTFPTIIQLAQFPVVDSPTALRFAPPPGNSSGGADSALEIGGGFGFDASRTSLAGNGCSGPRNEMHSGAMQSGATLITGEKSGRMCTDVRMGRTYFHVQRLQIPLSSATPDPRPRVIRAHTYPQAVAIESVPQFATSDSNDVDIRKVATEGRLPAFPQSIWFCGIAADCRWGRKAEAGMWDAGCAIHPTSQSITTPIKDNPPKSASVRFCRPCN
ncbi:hypothetical protein B0H19DRAFT_1080962 [Mycena capillaripes]|nr:hypothetical protein B0H19DRAFT_1080962 [Mycena capillaripes]